jgi:hypothetical protein
MRRPRLSSTGIESYADGYRYAVVRPTGRCSCRSFGHPFRAAEHAMRAYRLSSWTPLHDYGFTVRAFRDKAL